MPKIKFPYRVKLNGAYYEPGTAITVANADEYVKNGAAVVENTAAPEKTAQKKTTRAKTAK